MLDVKKEGIKLLIGLGIVIILIVAIRYFNISLWGVFCGLIGFNLISSIIKKSFTIKGFLMTVLYLVIVFAAILFLEPLWGMWSYFIVIFLICGIIIWRKRQKWLQVKHHIESMIWGKPIKELVKEGKWDL